MINIYLENTTDFNNNGLGILKDCISANVTAEINGEFSLSIEYPLYTILDEYLVEGNIIKSNVGNDDFQLFRIKYTTKTFNTIKIYATHISYDLMDNLIEDAAPTNLDCESFGNWILNKTQYNHNFTFNSNLTGIKSARYVRKNPIECIIGDIENSMTKLFGGELKRNNFNLKLLDRIGNDNNVKLIIGKNIKDITITTDISNLFTRIMPIGYDGLLIPEKYVDSPLINNYPTPKITKVEFSDIKYNPDDESSYHTLEEAYDALRNATYALYDSGIDKPSINIKINWIELSKYKEYYDKYRNLERVNLGDTIKAELLGLNFETRVIKTIYNVLTDTIDTFEIGTFKGSLGSTVNNINNKTEEINPNDILNQAKENASNLINTALGGYIYKTQSELFIMDTNDPQTATKIWRWNLNGLGYSANGIDGPYETAITQDGSIVADFITSGKINTSLIDGYDQLVLKASDNEDAISQLQIDNENITTTTSSIQNNLETNYYDITKVDELIQNAETGLTNTFLKSGGSNLLRNTAPFFMSSENEAEYWQGNVKQMKEINSASGFALLIQNGTLSQTIDLAPNQYAIKFHYKRLLLAATATVKYNGRTIELEEEGTIETTGTVNSGKFEFRVDCNIDDGYEIYDLMLNVGSIVTTWTQNANESTSDTVNISKGITVDSNTTNTKAKMDSDGFRVTNKSTGESVMEGTDEGGKFKKVEAEKGTIGGVIIQNVGNQSWISGV